MAKKPIRRYEIVQRLCEHPSGTPRWRWRIIEYYSNGDASSSYFRSGGDHVSDTVGFSDEQIINRAGLKDVTVPVYVIRNSEASDAH